MSVRKRRWVDPKGSQREAWVADYTDANGRRRLKTFSRKKDADAFYAKVKTEAFRGVHVSDGSTVTVEVAARNWINACEANRLERTTVENYQQLVRTHILPPLGTTKLTELTIPSLREFQENMREKGSSSDMVRRVFTALGSIVADAQERGHIAHNVIRDLKAGRGQKGNRRRLKKKLKVGVDIPSREEIRAILNAVGDKWRPLLMTAVFTGLRASELRGLHWSDIDFHKREIHVCRRADRHKDIGWPKSEAGNRRVPLTPRLATVLKEWKLRCPRRWSGERDALGNPITLLELVFPNGKGNVEEHANIIKRGFLPAQVAAGIVVPTETMGSDGSPILRARYAGLHSLRHFYASWCINRKEDGGLNLPPKIVQERLGHSSIIMTMDRYGHLFPRSDDADELAAAEHSLLLA